MTELSRGTLIREMKNFFRFFISPNLTRERALWSPSNTLICLHKFFSFSFHQHHLRFFLKLKNYAQWQQNFNLNSRLLFDYVWFRSFFFVFTMAWPLWLLTLDSLMLMWPQRANESCGLGSEVESVVQHNNEIFFSHFRVDKSSNYSYESLDCSMRQLKI